MSKVYFASDLHLGVPDKLSSLEREKIFVRWLNEIQKDAESIYLVGDIFDFWFEYKKAIPKGYTRLLGKLSEIADSGVPIYFFTGNHDMWAFDYLKEEVGIKEIYSMGGAQAIASLAYIQKVNKIVGPGNIFVAKAKQELFGQVGIESMVAGPSEITVLADSKTDIEDVLTSMIGQAEHDVNSQCILISKDFKIINEFNNKIKNKLKDLPRKSIAFKSLKNNGLAILAKNNSDLIYSINEIAPEHLEINISNPKKILNKIVNVGSVCIGKYSPMAASDYNVGTNHVLPTLGSAKFASGLNVSEFYKKISYITLSKKGVEKIGESATYLAEYEELYGHALSIRSRMRRK